MRYRQLLMVVIGAALVFSGVCVAADEDGSASIAKSANSMPSVPDVLEVITKATTPEGEEQAEWSGPIKLVIVFTALAIVPSLLIMMSSFTRIVIVLSFARRALGTQTIPPNTAVIGLAMFLTLFTMAPTFAKINDNALQPYLSDTLDFNTALTITGETMKEFMLKQTRGTDLRLFTEMAKIEVPEEASMLPLHVVVPSFIISEFRTAFEMGCLLFIPFLLIDLVISSILLSAGMMMLPPIMISLPFKLILFILVDGWALLAKSLSLSFQ
jgi:flagellar biosynthetic protein FliP